MQILQISHLKGEHFLVPPVDITLNTYTLHGCVTLMIIKFSLYRYNCYSR